jgi:hypothetical protein
MAVKTEIWVKAHLRRCFAAGLTGVVARRGAAEAGAVFVKVSLPGGAARILAPAAGPTYDEDGRRRWTEPLGTAPVPQEEIERFLIRQIAFDPDIWILDIDDPAGTGLLDSIEGRPDAAGGAAIWPFSNR